VKRLRRSLHPALGGGSAWLVATSVTIFCTLLFFTRGVVALDGWCFGTALTAGFCVVLGCVAGCTVRALEMWRSLRRLLEFLALTPFVSAFDRVPAAMGRRVGLHLLAEPSAALMVRYALESAEARRDSSVASDSLRADPPQFDLKKSMRHDDCLAPMYEMAQLQDLSADAGRVIGATLTKPLRNSPDERRHDPAATKKESRPPTPEEAREELAATFVTQFSIFVFFHIRSVLRAAIVGALLVLLAAASYPFRPQQYAIRWIQLAFAAVMLATIVVLVQSDRD
jgi:hypothetical protein